MVLPSLQTCWHKRPASTTNGLLSDSRSCLCSWCKQTPFPAQPSQAVLYPDVNAACVAGRLTQNHLSLFVVNIVVVQATGHANVLHDSLAPAPDLGTYRAKKNLLMLMPGEIAGVLALVTFGTTKHFRDTMYRTFVPKRWQRAEQPRDVEGGTVGGVSFISAMTAPAAVTVVSEGGALGRRFGDRGSWTRGVTGIVRSVPLQDLRSPIFRDSVWRESTLSSIPEYPV